MIIIKQEDIQTSSSLGVPPSNVGGVFSLNTGSPAPTEDAISKSVKQYLNRTKTPRREDFGGYR